MHNTKHYTRSQTINGNAIIGVSTPTHEWDFRGCTTGSTTLDTYSTTLVATPFNGPTCSSSGMTFSGSSQYVQLTSYSWGGLTSLETYAVYTLAAAYSPLIFFGSGAPYDNLMITTVGTQQARFDSELFLQFLYVSVVHVIDSLFFCSNPRKQLANSAALPRLDVFHGEFLGTRSGHNFVVVGEPLRQRPARCITIRHTSPEHSDPHRPLPREVVV